VRTCSDYLYSTVCTEKYTHSLQVPIYRLGVINQCFATKIHARVLFVFLLSFNLNSLSLYYHSDVCLSTKKGESIVYCLLLALIDPLCTYPSFHSVYLYHNLYSFLCCSPALDDGTTVAHHGLFVPNRSGVGARRWIPVGVLVAYIFLSNKRCHGGGVGLVDVYPPNIAATRHAISSCAQSLQGGSWPRQGPPIQGVGGAAHGGVVGLIRQNNLARGKRGGALTERLGLGTATGFHHGDQGIMERWVCTCKRDCRATFVRKTWETGAGGGVWHQHQGGREQQGRRSTEHLCGGLCSGNVAIQLP
jgi:hypothetical protein